MFSNNPFSILSETISPFAMQSFIIAMVFRKLIENKPDTFREAFHLVNVLDESLVLFLVVSQ